MIAESTKLAVIALLAADKTATEAERDAVARAMQGEIAGPQILSIKEVAALLQRSRQTVHHLIQKGRLVPVKGAGKYNTGITAESVHQYLHPTPKQGAK